MTFTLIPLGGVNEIGRNCFALDIDGKIIILDMGFHLERFVELTETDFPQKKHSVRRFITAGALPDIRHLRKRKHDVVGIICSHAHLDHVAGIPFLANRFNCSVHATPFTGQLIRSLAQDRGKQVTVVEHEQKSTFVINDITIEFIPVAHSTPHSVVIAVHTKDGVVLYANDFKNDQHPPFENPTDITRLQELKGKVKLLILDSLYAPRNEHAPSEFCVQEQLNDLVPKLTSHRAIIASTFSSHIYRLKELCAIADTLKRKVVFIGRSLARYITAAKNADVVNLEKRGIVLKYASQAKVFFEKLHNPQDYFLIVTGHQGEPQAVLNRMADGLFPFTKEDVVIFSCQIIPVPISIKHRQLLEDKLHKKKVSMFTDVHVSGHAFAKDHRFLVSLLEPELVVPVHGEPHMIKAMQKITQVHTQAK
ncbi:MBL fold metallo-hydrolase, partial [Candidatus Woesearchaeota archaeon]|nr:MBL fold metallo-hydrolase [Candidatus Woesearchaeota archaeon]